jgi:hypothetical protein
MTQQTTCPACGAPVEYSEQQDMIRCGFCGAEFRINNEPDQPPYQILSQPDPQKEVLSQPAAHLTDEPFEGASTVSSTDAGSHAETDSYTQSGSLFDQTSMGQSAYDSASSQGAAQSYANPPDAFQSIPYTSPASTSTTTSTSSGSGVVRWVIIGVAAVLGLCVACSCLVGAIVLLQARGNY